MPSASEQLTEASYTALDKALGNNEDLREALHILIVKARGFDSFVSEMSKPTVKFNSPIISLTQMVDMQEKLLKGFNSVLKTVEAKL